MALCPEHPKRDQNPKFTPLSETTSIPVCFIWESPPPGLGQWIIESKVYLLSMLGRKKKGSRLRLCFGVVDEYPEKNEWICESRYTSSSKCLFCGILFALKPFRDYSLCSVCNLPQPAFYSQSVVCILHAVCILPLVRSLQSAAVRSLPLLTDYES